MNFSNFGTALKISDCLCLDFSTLKDKRMMGKIERKKERRLTRKANSGNLATG